MDAETGFLTVRRFLLEHFVRERNLSRKTQTSYRDTLTLLLPFAAEHSGRAIDRMPVEDLTPVSDERESRVAGDLRRIERHPPSTPGVNIQYR